MEVFNVDIHTLIDAWDCAPKFSMEYLTQGIKVPFEFDGRLWAVTQTAWSYYPHDGDEIVRWAKLHRIYHVAEQPPGEERKARIPVRLEHNWLYLALEGEGGAFYIVYPEVIALCCESTIPHKVYPKGDLIWQQKALERTLLKSSPKP